MTNTVKHIIFVTETLDSKVNLAHFILYVVYISIEIAGNNTDLSMLKTCMEMYRNAFH